MDRVEITTDGFERKERKQKQNRIENKGALAKNLLITVLYNGSGREPWVK